MGTNFYLRKKEPRIVYDEYHIAKTSYGWEPSFEGYIKDEYDKSDRPQITCIEDIKAAYDSGDFIFVDEYGDEYSWEEFEERVINWNGGNCPNQPLKHSNLFNYCDFA